MNPFIETLLRAHPKSAPVLEPWYAFAHEVALAPRKVSEATIGHIRLKWWMDAAEEVLSVDTPRAHPAVTTWRESLDQQGHKPAPGLVRAFVEAQSLQLEKAPYNSFEDLRADVTARWGNQLRVGLQLLEVGDENHHHAANHIGAAFGLLETVFGLEYEGQRGRQTHALLPADISKATAETRQEVVQETVGQAAFHLDRALELLPKAQPRAFPVLRLGIATRMLIETVVAQGYDPLNLPPMGAVAQTFAWRLTVARFRGRYA